MTGKHKRKTQGLVMLMLLVSACGKGGTTTAPSATTASTTPVTDPTPATQTDTFAGTLGVGGTIYQSFTVSQYGTVTATLASIGGSGVPATVHVRLGIGVIDDTGCNASALSVVNTASPTVTALEDPGTYCADVTDVGNLFSTATFVITILHP